MSCQDMTQQKDYSIAYHISQTETTAALEVPIRHGETMGVRHEIKLRNGMVADNEGCEAFLAFTSSF